MKIKQIGNGGGLEVNNTNSSFIIEYNNNLTLIDCGFNVPKKLFDLHDIGEIDISKLKSVFITHSHADHIGGLETLIFKMFYEYNIILDCYVGNPVSVSAIEDLNQVYENSVVKYKQLSNTVLYQKNKKCFLESDNEAFIIPFENNHKFNHSFGFSIIDKGKVKVVISGDTKAFAELEEYAKEAALIFHDYSEWDCQSKNFHACKSDITETYSKEFIKKLTFYHNNKDYNGDWIKI